MSASPPPLALAAGLLAVLIWGATPPITKFTVGALDPLLVGAMRTMLAAAVALPITLATGLPRPGAAAEWAALAVSAACGFVLFPMLFTLGQHLTSAAHGALILAALPLFTGVIAALFERRMPATRFWIGSAIALAGEYVLIAGRFEDAAAQAGWIGDAVILAAAVCASLGYVVGARLSRRGLASPSVTLWGVIIAGLALAPALPWLAADLRWAASGWLGVGYLALGSTIAGYIAWYFALARGGIARLGLLQFLQPPVGVALAMIWLGEELTASLLVAATAILVGVYIAARG